jgi:anti-anti-sigma factor
MLVLRDDVDIYCAGPLHESADALLQEQEDVVVSCEALSHLDTSALQILLALREELQTRGRSLRLAGISADVETLLRLAGVRSLLLSQTTAQCH